MKRVVIMKRFIFLIAFLLLSCSQKRYSETDFWDWFVQNESELLNFTESNRDELFDELSAQLIQIDTNLTFEFSAERVESKKEFIISAGGITDAFPAVELLYNSQPEVLSENWRIFKYRQRKPMYTISYGDITVDPDDVKCQLFVDETKLGLMLFFKVGEIPEDDYVTYASIGYLLLDQTIGEYDVATKLGFIDFQTIRSEYYVGSFPLKELANRVDEFYAE